MEKVEYLLRPHLQREEGFRKHAYPDHLGYLTIGYGRMIDERRGGGISEREAETLLDNDIWVTLSALEARIPWYLQLSDVRKAVLASMAYQMGIHGLLMFNNTLRMVFEGDYEGAAMGMRDSLWFRQTPARAERMAKAMETNDPAWLKF